MQLLPVKTVAHTLSCSIKHVRDLIREKELPAVKLGYRTVRVRQSDLDAYIRRKRSA